MIDQEKASDSIIKLSEIMRYMLYDSNTDKVDLEKEISYLRSYISLQRIRLLKPAFVTFQLDGDCHGLKIAPMLFIPFVENAFKHGAKSVDPPGIKIAVTCTHSMVKLEIENFISNDKGISKDQARGIGLSNIRRRLELLYPDRHTLKIMEKNGLYTVVLSIDL
jgi:LytS/YehU family sensor histidine kinase